MWTLVLHMRIVCALISGCLSATLVSTSPEILALKIFSPIIRYNPESKSVVVESNKEVTMQLIGIHMNNIKEIKLVANKLGLQTECNNTESQPLTFSEEYQNFANSDHLMEVESVKLEENTAKSMYFLCVNTNNSFIAFNRSDLAIIAIKVEEPTELLSIPVKIIIVVCLMLLSGLFSGLSLGLMSLTPEELVLVIKSSKNEKHVAYAKVLYPVRLKGNFLLCSLLIGNVLVNTSISLLMGDLLSGPVALIVSTLIIVIVGEIIPQSICHKYGLAVGAQTIWITKAIMCLTAPLSWPIAKILDVLLKSEYSREYNRDRLCDFMKIQCEHSEKSGSLKEQMKVVKSALDFGKMTVQDRMVGIDKMFALEENTKLSRKKLVDIAVAGHTRIPVYSGEKTNITMMLNVKDLAILDPDDDVTVGTVAKQWKRPIQFVPSSMKLVDCLSVLLKESTTSHLLIVREGENGATMGIITLEDVVECLVGGEIPEEGANGGEEDKKKKKKTARRILKEVLGPKDPKKSAASV